MILKIGQNIGHKPRYLYLGFDEKKTGRRSIALVIFNTALEPVVKDLLDDVTVISIVKSYWVT